MSKFVVFEGIDGSGKTTLSRMLVKHLNDNGVSAVCYDDLEKKDEGFNLLKPYIKEFADIETSFYFYYASSLHKSHKIRQLLSHTWVICDRYVFSTIAHHVCLGFEIEKIPELSNSSLLYPDHYFLIEANDDVRLCRVMQREILTENDKIPCKPGTVPYRKVEILKKYNPTLIDNSEEGVATAFSKICEELGISK